MADFNEEIERELEREEQHLATVRQRAAAAVIDELLMTALLLILLWDRFAEVATIEESIALTNAFILEFMAIKIIYQTFFVYQYGATIGKIVMKIRVAEQQGFDSPTLVASFNRAVFRIVSEIIFYLG